MDGARTGGGAGTGVGTGTGVWGGDDHRSESRDAYGGDAGVGGEKENKMGKEKAVSSITALKR